MNDQESESYLESAFRCQKKKALEFIDQFNERLPSQNCPNCGIEGHVPGLPCPAADCGYKHEISWAILLDTEFGYDVVALNDKRGPAFARFNVADQ